MGEQAQEIRIADAGGPLARGVPGRYFRPMRTVLWLLPAGLSILVLGAHLLRHLGTLPALPCLALLALLFVRRPWAARTMQAALLLGVFEWLRTLGELLPARRAAGEPWVRLVAILGSVALVALFSALAFEAQRLRRHFRLGPVREER